ncbi:SDR family NAD(P)-dependent oxidoreductase [Aquicoccus sp.]|uniref:SDR family NAD(P)-dependent oxidoreductase n=1 Tax=Aquicoccus sp. TaxID=2055851 RepID=UPI00356207DA
MEKKIALITGASRGLGAGLAEALCDTHHIVAVARTTGALEELDDRIQSKGGSATLAPMDISKADAMAQLCRSIYDRWGSADIWAHCAIHAAPLSPADHIDSKDWDKSVSINVTASGTLIAFVAPLLSETGKALFFDDPHAGEKFFGAYGATKAAQIALATSWAAEKARSSTQVHVLAPRPMATATRARFFPGEDRTSLAAPFDEALRLLHAVGMRDQHGEDK